MNSDYEPILSLKEVKKDFDAIASAVGNAKQDVICRISRESPYSYSLLINLLNPFVVFGIGEKSIGKNVPVKADREFADIQDLLFYLKQSRSASHQVIANVQGFLNQIEDVDLRDFAEAYITKTLRLGVTGKTLNKAVGKEVVPEVKCMLANKYFEHASHVDGKEFYVTEKLDGIRCLCFIKDGQIPMFFTRQGQKIDGLIEIEADLIEWMGTRPIDIMLDGELLISDRDKYESKEQYKRTTKIVRKDGDKHGVTFHVFDVVGKGREDSPYWARRYWIEQRIQGMDHVKFLPVLYQGTNPGVIPELLEQQRSLGHEGVMVNIADAPYQAKRTNDLLKCKLMQDCDLEVVGFQEGSGKFKGTLGAMLVRYKGNIVGVGSGFNDRMRQEVWNHQERYLGRVATIQYFEETCDADGKLSIRFPVFKDFCEEGKEVSYN